MLDRFSPRLALRQWERHLMARNQQIMAADELAQAAIVFAPHPDDETLGCGGTILAKKAVGAAVQIVYMTDGSRSHTAHIDPAELRVIRRQEALLACQALGVAAADVTFLDIEDGHLGDHQDLAQQQVAAILQTVQPAQIFMPYRRDPHPDHIQTSLCVLAALQRCQMPMTVYEYPVWAWHHQPWTRAEPGLLGYLRSLKKAIKWGFGWQMVQDFRWAVPIQAVLAAKRSALAHHQTQFTEFRPNVNWVKIQDFSDGEFLDCFFQDYELFRRSEIYPRRDSALGFLATAKNASQ
jgi:LmbE family N-acetylglucosaminyl deacetylase